jgi:hydrogenase maturation protein HypF
LERWQISVQGVVQGVGFRPFVWTLAHEYHCSGWVCNDARGVTIEIQGSRDELQGFLKRLTSTPPPLARVATVEFYPIGLVADEATFQIRDSLDAFRTRHNSGQPLAFVSPDVAPCAACLDELRDPSNRRYAYPFINCTNCGPRFTIQQAVPYDRSQTTMRAFAMCSLCQSEYESPADRRFHAQPNACHSCGPAIWYRSPHVAANDGSQPPSCAATTLASIARVRSEIAAGKIVAIKGIGGFHLACDARNAAAVDELRRRKRRTHKPLAVMVADIITANTLVHLDPASERLLSTPQRPIVLLPKRAGVLPESVSPHNPYLGILLPYAPMHHLLLGSGDVWIMTSGNLADEPIAFENEDALIRLAHLSDGFLLHNRPIQAVCDDSVLRAYALGPIPIRRSRGFAPLPIELASPGDCVLAVGGELKAALCLALESHAVLGQHVGDMGHRETLLALERSRDHLLALYQAAPQAIACDLHPGYISTDWARQQAQRLGLPLVRVQHHHAHAASLMAEHRLAPEQPLIACVFDGTGYGSDGAIWGGEVLLATATDFQRLAHLQYMPLPGGDSCILQPAKTALAYLYAAGLPWISELPCVQHFSDPDRARLRQQLEQGINTMATSSMGRLFDAVAALIGLRQTIDYEGQAAFEFEALAEAGLTENDEYSPYPFCWSEEPTAVLQLGALLKTVYDDVLDGVERKVIAVRFHQTIAAATVEICQRLRNAASVNLQSGPPPGSPTHLVGLTGGVFQNGVLLQLLHHRLQAAGFDVLIHSAVPPNDGGLALGQAVVARHTTRRTSPVGDS